MTNSSDNLAVSELGLSTPSLRCGVPDHDSEKPNYDIASPLQEFALPRPDGGKEAWMFLIGCFFIEGLVWGFPFAFGVFQDYYACHEPFSSYSSSVAIIGTSATGIMYLSSPCICAAFERYPSIRRPSSVIGLSLATVALIISSFSTTVVHLILTQGILYGIGGSLLYYPAMLFVDEWFIQRKGLAYGVMWAGGAFSGVIMPYLLSLLLELHGFRFALRIWAIILLVLTSPLLLFIKPRLPLPTSNRPPRIHLSFLTSRTFIFLELGNILESLGFFLPSLYLPTYVSSLGFTSTTETSTPLALLNAAQIFGCVFLGSLTDRFNVTTALLITTVGATFSVFLLWGFSSSLPLIVSFAITYGFFAGSFSSTWSGLVAEIRKKDSDADVGLLFGLFCAGRGIGSVLCGPLSSALLRVGTKYGAAGIGAYGMSGWSQLVIFTGCSAAMGGMGWIARVGGII